MRLKYWMLVYPFQMAGGEHNKPFVSNTPLAAPADAKVLSFYVDVPDGLFGATEVPVTQAQADGDPHVP